jgi:hypothetical protein
MKELMDINLILQASTTVAGFSIIVVSIIAIHTQRKTAKQKFTMEYLQLLTFDENLKISAKFLRDCYLDNNKSVELIASSNKEEYKKQQDSLVPILNYFETLAIGVEIKIYDLNTIKLSRKQQVIHTFKQSEPYIKKIREKLKNDNLFINLENLSKKLAE